MNRAEQAEKSITTRYIKPVSHLPFTQLGMVTWPPQNTGHKWHYWWQAHLLDCLIDAQLRHPTHERLVHIRRQIRSHWLRNTFRWTNGYYDDMAWLGLALERSNRLLGSREQRAQSIIMRQLLSAWMPERGGGIPWRKNKEDRFFNAPANGPAGIFLARVGKTERAREMSNWMHDHLLDTGTGLMYDGVHESGRMETQIYTYCQGVALGLETELAQAYPGGPHLERACNLIDAIEMHLTHRGVIFGGSQGDGGLFEGILARYLALAAVQLPGKEHATAVTRNLARNIVLASANSAWSHRMTYGGITIFPTNWTKFDTEAVHGYDLSVQLSGWMLMEAAHMLDGNS